MKEADDPDSVELTPWEARRMRLQKQAMRELLVEMGFTPDEPQEAQQDQAWVRRARKREESITAKVLGAIITLLITPGVVAAIVASLAQQHR